MNEPVVKTSFISKRFENGYGFIMSLDIYNRSKASSPTNTYDKTFSEFVILAGIFSDELLRYDGNTKYDPFSYPGKYSGNADIFLETLPSLVLCIEQNKLCMIWFCVFQQSSRYRLSLSWT